MSIAQAEARRLIERVHGEGESLAGEQPLVFDPRHAGRLLAVGESGERPTVRSACAILVRELMMPGSRLRAGLIGSVTTDPDWRERGAATRLLVEAEAALEREGCALALLWADDPTFYLRRGYVPVGCEVDFVLEAERATELPEVEGVRAARASDAAAIHALYERHPARCGRSPGETEALLGCPGMETLVSEHEGSLLAYACQGRGRDLTRTVHEWGGPAEPVLGLVRAHLERLTDRNAGADGAEQGSASTLFLMVPPTAAELVSRLRELGFEGHEGILGLGKILDRAAAARALAEKLGPAGSCEPDPGFSPPRLHLSGPKGESLLDDDASAALLAGSPAVRADVASLLERFGLEGCDLPLTPFLWGLDSI